MSHDLEDRPDRVRRRDAWLESQGVTVSGSQPEALADWTTRPMNRPGGGGDDRGSRLATGLHRASAAVPLPRRASGGG